MLIRGGLGALAAWPIAEAFLRALRWYQVAALVIEPLGVGLRRGWAVAGRLRSRRFPAGLGRLGHRAREQVAEENRLAELAGQAIEIVGRSGGGATVEDRADSLLPLLDPVRRLRAAVGDCYGEVLLCLCALGGAGWTALRVIGARCAWLRELRLCPGNHPRRPEPLIAEEPEPCPWPLAWAWARAAPGVRTLGDEEPGNPPSPALQQAAAQFEHRGPTGPRRPRGVWGRAGLHLGALCLLCCVGLTRPGVSFEPALPLRWADVTHVTKTRYQAAFETFLRFAKRECFGVQPERPEDVDDAFELFVNECYVAGQGSRRQLCVSALYGLYRRWPRLKGRMLGSMAALRSWAKARPGRAFLPVPWHVALLLSRMITSRGYPDLGYGVLLAHHGLLRVGELLRLRWADIKDIPRTGKLLIRLQKTKTGANQHVMVEDKRLVELTRTLRNRSDPQAFVLSVGYNVLRGLFRDALAACGLGGLHGGSRFSFHSLRHGGATELAVSGLGLELIAKRGRWAALQSAARYVQLGVSLLAVVRLRPDLVVPAARLEQAWPYYRQA